MRIAVGGTGRVGGVLVQEDLLPLPDGVAIVFGALGLATAPKETPVARAANDQSGSPDAADNRQGSGAKLSTAAAACRGCSAFSTAHTITKMRQPERPECLSRRPDRHDRRTGLRLLIGNVRRMG
jgi:hypothetical protein